MLRRRPVCRGLLTAELHNSRSTTHLRVPRPGARGDPAADREAARSHTGADDGPIRAPGPRLDSDRRGSDHREHRREFVVNSRYRKVYPTLGPPNLHHILAAYHFDSLSARALMTYHRAGIRKVDRAVDTRENGRTTANCVSPEP